MAALYDDIGRSYAHTRRPDPRIDAAIRAAIGDAGSVLNVGAGTGSYEPPQTVLAVEPSATMIAQRPAASAPVVQAVAEALPLPDRSVDVALGVLTVQHWTSVPAGLAELARVSRRRVVLLTWEPDAIAAFWLFTDYLPAAAATDRALAVPSSAVRAVLPTATSTPVPVPHDCTDGFGGAYWRRPEAYLDPVVQAGMSMLARTDPALLRPGLDQLARDLADGSWRCRHADLLELDELDLGFRLVVAELA